MSNSTKPAERMLRCFRMADLTLREQIVLAVIAVHDGGGGAFPGVERIAELAGCSTRRVEAALTSLEQKERLKRHRRGRKSNRYRVFYGVKDPPNSGGSMTRRNSAGRYAEGRRIKPAEQRRMNGFELEENRAREAAAASEGATARAQGMSPETRASLQAMYPGRFLLDDGGREHDG